MPPEAHNPPPPRKPSLAPPLLASLVLVLLLAGLSWFLWKHFAPHFAGDDPRLLQEEADRRTRLEAGQERLKSLMNLPPCELKARLEGGTAVVAPAKPVRVLAARAEVSP